MKQINITDILFKNTFYRIPAYIKIRAVDNRKHKYWCPYCNQISEFKKDKYLGVRRCTSCGISTKDFHVRTVNKLWHK